MGAPQGGGGDFGEAEIPDLAGLHQFRHGAYRVFDGHLLVQAVQVIEIDAVGAEALKACVATRGDLVGVAVDAALAVRVDPHAELCCEYDLVAPFAKHASDQFFVVPEPVRIGSVEEIHADIERPVQGTLRPGRIRLPVGLGHTHAAKAYLTHFKLAEQSLLQHLLPRGGNTISSTARILSVRACRIQPARRADHFAYPDRQDYRPGVAHLPAIRPRGIVPAPRPRTN